MKNNKKLTLPIITTLIIAAFFIQVNPVSAQDTIFYMNTLDGAGLGSSLHTVHPAGAGGRSMVYTNFAAANTGYLSNMIVGVIRSDAGNTMDNVVLRAELHSLNPQAYTTTPSDSGTLLATSSNRVTLDTDLSTVSYTQIQFQFNQTYQITSGTYYSMWVLVESATYIAEDHQIYLQRSTGGSPAYGENNYGGTIQAPNTNNEYSAVISGFAAAATPTPTSAPTPTATPNFEHGIWNGTHWVDDDNVVEEYTDLVLPLLIPLIIILICAGLGAYFIGLWGFILGLDVAVVLLYVALPSYMPLWGVIIVAVGNLIVLLMGRR